MVRLSVQCILLQLMVTDSWYKPTRHVNISPGQGAGGILACLVYTGHCYRFCSLHLLTTCMGRSCMAGMWFSQPLHSLSLGIQCVGQVLCRDTLVRAGMQAGLDLLLQQAERLHLFRLQRPQRTLLWLQEFHLQQHKKVLSRSMWSPPLWVNQTSLWHASPYQAWLLASSFDIL